MQNIEFTYKVISIPDDGELSSMIVEYSALGYDTLQVGMPLPFSDGTIDDQVLRYAPIGSWEVSKKTLLDVQGGHSGSLTYVVSLPPGILVPGAEMASGIQQMQSAQLEEAKIAAVVQRVLSSMAEGTI